MKTTQSAMLFFQVLPFTDMKKRYGFLCVKTLMFENEWHLGRRWKTFNFKKLCTKLHESTLMYRWRAFFFCNKKRIVKTTFDMILKGTATLMIRMFYMNKLSEPWILIPVSS